MSARGFSLIEVLVALLVASVTLAALARSSRAILRSRHESEATIAMTLAAQRGLEEMLAADTATFAERDETGELPGGRFTARRIVRRGPEENLWHLEVVVADASGREVRLHTLRRVPWRMNP